MTAAGLDVWIGGEPTFTARGDQARQDQPEWQGGALGPDKWTRGRKLAAELRDRLAPGGVILHRMGKHYPGESLPRWALDVIARRGSAPAPGPELGPEMWPELWPDRRLTDSGSISAAERFGVTLTGALGVARELHPAFEDPWEIVRAEATWLASGIGRDSQADSGRSGAVFQNAAAGESAAGRPRRRSDPRSGDGCRDCESGPSADRRRGGGRTRFCAMRRRAAADRAD